MSTGFEYPASSRQSRNHPFSSSLDTSPKKQEWALINQYKALQYERLKQREKELAYQKMNNFRRELDNQLSSKGDAKQMDKQSDKRYYQYITEQANLMKIKQQKEMQEKAKKRKEVESQNRIKFEMDKRFSRNRSNDTGYHLEIGHKSEEDRKRKAENIKRDVLDTLGLQLKKKQLEREMNKVVQIQTDKRNLEYQYNHHDSRRSPQKDFKQNQSVFNYYFELQRKRQIQNAQIERKLVQDAALRQRRQQDERIRKQAQKKNHIRLEVKEALDQQVRAHDQQRSQKSRLNPQEYSYGVISSIFKEKPAAYDKQKYSTELKRQADEQRLKKQSSNFMSEEEYRLNMNQLNKVVNGEYARRDYVDRSMGSIGDSKMLMLGDIRDSLAGNMDTEAVKNRLNTLRLNRNNTIPRSSAVGDSIPDRARNNSSIVLGSNKTKV